MAQYDAFQGGQTLTWNGTSGIDTLYFDPRANHGIKLTLDASGFIHVDSTTGASGYHFTLKNVEKVIYANHTYNLTTMFPSAFAADTTAPTVTSYSPADGVTDALSNANIVITFNEKIVVGTGNIVIKSGAAVVATYDVATSTNLTISGKILTINPTDDLLLGTTYSVEFAAGTIKDVAGNSFAAATTYTFTTAATSTINGTAGVDNLIGTSNDDQINGLAGNDNLAGGAGNDTLDGGVGNDILNGGTGADTMTGGFGNDTYVVDDAGDVVTENNALAAGGADTVQVAIATADGAYTLGVNVENGTLTNTVAYNLTGNSLVNKLTGNASANVLEGGAGVDALIGGAGDDTYRVNLKTTGAGTLAVASLEDVITETAVFGSGNDTVVLTSAAILTKSSTLTLANSLENLDTSLTGSTLLNLTGNNAANILTGNDAANILNGGAGADTLVGGLGNDTLIGGLGADTLTGGAGNDVYIIDSAISDVINEESNTDTGDTVIYSVNASATLTSLLTIGSLNTDAVKLTATTNASLDLTQIENLTLTGTGKYDLTGNALDNILTGNASINTLTGGTGNDTLDGGLGNDTLIGGQGNDTYVINALTDVITELTGQGSDTVNAAFTLDLNSSYFIGKSIENITLLGKAVINATGDGVDNILTGNSAANTLNGGAGADTMVGGDGADTYVVDDAGDVVTENNALAAGGADTVKIAITIADGTYTLGDNVENGTLTNAVAYNLTGNSLVNKLTGNASANVLEGGAGVDTLIGGAGDDTYRVNLKTTGAGTLAVASLEDVITEAALGGTDTVILTNSVSLTKASTLTLALNLENLDASGTGTTLLNLTGNAANNILTGNDAANTVNGGGGADALNGGLGNDILTGGLGADTFVFNSALNATTNLDGITDFLSGTDHIQLDHAIFTALSAGTLSAANIYDSNVGPVDANDFIGYNSSTGALYYDADGSGVGAGVQFATLTGHPTLLATDIIVV